MDTGALVLAAGLLGLAGLPHCAAMCAAPCAAATRACGPERAVLPAFHLGRLAGYATAGAVAAASAGALQQWLGAVPALRAFWVLLQLAMLALGSWMLLRGRMPLWRPIAPPPGGLRPVHWSRLPAPARSAALGSAWIAWPCALSQSALLLALLANRPWEGAAAMGAFALASSPGLVVGPVLLQHIGRRTGAGAAAGLAWPVRAAGFTMAAAAAWALGHGVWLRVAAWCGL